MIRLNWQLVDAPLSVLEYVVAHEIVHLLHRNHGDGLEGNAIIRHAGLEDAESSTGILGGAG